MPGRRTRLRIVAPEAELGMNRKQGEDLPIGPRRQFAAGQAGPAAAARAAPIRAQVLSTIEYAGKDDGMTCAPGPPILGGTDPIPGRREREG